MRAAPLIQVCQIQSIDALMIGFVFGVAFASLFFTIMAAAYFRAAREHHP